MSARIRLFTDIRDELLTVVPTPHVGIDLRGYMQLTGDQFVNGAVFVVAGSGGGNVQYHPERRVREEMTFSIQGYVKSSMGTFNDVHATREAFYKKVWDKLTGLGMQTRLDVSLAANNQNGAVQIFHTSDPDTDEGQVPPFGYFRLPMMALLHIPLGTL